MQLALVNNRTLVPVHELNRIFDRQDVICLGFVDAIEDCR